MASIFFRVLHFRGSYSQGLLGPGLDLPGPGSSLPAPSSGLPGLAWTSQGLDWVRQGLVEAFLGLDWASLGLALVFQGLATTTTLVQIACIFQDAHYKTSPAGQLDVLLASL